MSNTNMVDIRSFDEIYDDEDAEESFCSEPSSLQLDELLPADSLLMSPDPSTSLSAVPGTATSATSTCTTPVAFLGDVHEQEPSVKGGSILQILGLAEGKKASDKQAPKTPQKENDIEEQGGEKAAERGLYTVNSNAETEPESPEKLAGTNTTGPLPETATAGAAPKAFGCCTRRVMALLVVLALVALIIIVPLVAVNMGGSSTSATNLDQGAGNRGNTVTVTTPAPVPIVLETLSPTQKPTVSPTDVPTLSPTHVPTLAPTDAPTDAPTLEPTLAPTLTPSVSAGPSVLASSGPSVPPSDIPSSLPSLLPSSLPSPLSSAQPSLSFAPTTAPSDIPSAIPSPTPTFPLPTLPPLDLFQLVSTVTPLEQLEDNTTAQYAALQWLETVDTRRTLTEPQVLQRYALAVLDFSLHTSGGQSSQATSTAVNGLFSECSWTGVGCNADLQVTSLNWANSGLNGQMPAELGVLRNLTHLDLGENQIGGPLPDALYDLTELESLYLHQNKLTGIISDRIENLYGLVNLYLSNNQLSGEFPVNLGSLRGGRGNRRLRILTLRKNNFSGRIPLNLNLRFLYYLDLSYNQFSGPLPTDWSEGDGTLIRMRHFHVDNNRFTGAIPATYPLMGDGRLEQFTANDNLLTGVVPGGWPRGDHISSMEVQNNFFSSLGGAGNNGGTSVCDLIVFNGGEMINFDADCEVCSCNYFCGPNQCY